MNFIVLILLQITMYDNFPHKCSMYLAGGWANALKCHRIQSDTRNMAMRQPTTVTLANFLIKGEQVEHSQEKVVCFTTMKCLFCDKI